MRWPWSKNNDEERSHRRGRRSDKEEVRQDFMLETYDKHKDSIICMCLSVDKSLLITGSEDRSVMLWTTKTTPVESLGTLSGHSGYITCVAVHDAFIITGSSDTTIKKWDMTSLKCLYTYHGHALRISRIICTSDYIFSTSYDKTARLWIFNANKEENLDPKDACFMTYKGHNKGVFPLLYISGMEAVDDEDDEETLIVNPGDILLTGGFDYVVKKWSVKTGQCLQTFKGHKGEITCMTTDASVDVLITGSADSTVRTWDLHKGKSLRVLKGHVDKVMCVVFDNRNIYSGSQDQTVKAWVKEYEDCSRTFKGHGHSVNAIKIYRNFLFTACSDMQVRAFDLKTGKLARTFRGHEWSVTCMVIVGDRLFTGSTDGVLKIWDLKKMDRPVQADQPRRRDRDEEEDW